MSQPRLSIRQIRELLRLKYELERNHREISASLGITNSTVSGYVRRASVAGLSWPLPEGLDDAALEAALFPAAPPSRVPRPKPDWGRVHRELWRHKGVTLQLLCLEYREVHPNGYQYSWFCGRYKAWRKQLDVVMRRVYRARMDFSPKATEFPLTLVEPRPRLHESSGFDSSKRRPEAVLALAQLRESTA